MKKELEGYENLPGSEQKLIDLILGTNDKMAERLRLAYPKLVNKLRGEVKTSKKIAKKEENLQFFNKQIVELWKEIKKRDKLLKTMQKSMEYLLSTQKNILKFLKHQKSKK